MATVKGERFMTARPRATGAVYLWQPSLQLRQLGFPAKALNLPDGTPSPFAVACAQARRLNAILDQLRAGEAEAATRLIALWHAESLASAPPVDYRWPGGAETLAPRRLSFAEAAELYLKSQFFLNLRDNTQRQYISYIADLKRMLGAEAVAALTRAPLRAAYERLIKAHGAASANYRMRVASCVLSHAVEMEWIAGNPLTRFNYLPVKGRIVVPSAAEHETLMQACGARLDTRALIALAAFTGQRRGDLVVLEIADYRAGQIFVEQSKRGRLVSIGVLPELAAALDPYLAELERRYGDIAKHFAAMKLQHGKTQRFRRLAAPPILWSFDTGLPIEPWRCSKDFAAVRDVAARQMPSVARLKLSDFRDFAMTDMFRAGLTDAEANAMVGHGDNTGALKRKHYVERFDPHIMRAGFAKWQAYRAGLKRKAGEAS
jgi:integrase